MREFFAARAENLAFVHLTRRTDLVVNRVASPDGSVDFLVTVRRGGVPTGRMFGVQVNAREGSVARAADLEAFIEPVQTGSVADATIPFCVFVFTMSDDRGYFRWLKEPAVGARRKPVLRAEGGIGWSDLDRDALDRIVDAVDAWYEAQQRPQAA
jgi:hypothetical protein